MNLSKDYPAKRSRRQGRGERYREGRPRRPDGPSFRLFVAVEIPEEATGGLVAWQRDFLAVDRALRLVPREQLHITLIFLGQKSEEELVRVSGQLDELADEDPLTSFEAAATAMVGLPKGRTPRVIAASIEEPAGRLKSIHGRLAAALARKQLFQSQRRQFFPHVTIARARGRVRLDLDQMQPEPVKFTAVRITLYNSILKSSGAIHQALKTVQLK